MKGKEFFSKWKLQKKKKKTIPSYHENDQTHHDHALKRVHFRLVLGHLLRQLVSAGALGCNLFCAGCWRSKIGGGGGGGGGGK